MKKVLIVLSSVIFLFTGCEDEVTENLPINTLEADAGNDQQVKTKQMVVLDGSNSKDANEKASWLERCPIDAFKNRILKGKVTEKEIVKIEEEVEKEVKAAVQFAIDSPYPDPSEAYTDIFSDM